MRRLCFALLLLAVALPSGARAEYPDRPIRLIVPQAAGSATDTVARILARRARRRARPDRRRRRPAGRRADPRHRSRRQVRARRLHHRHGADRRARHHPPHGGEAALRHRARLPADRADRARAPAARGVAEAAVQLGAGADRLRQGQSRQAPQRVVEQRLARPCRRRAVQVHDRHGDRARALQGRRGRDQRPDRRPRAADVREPQLDRAARACGAACGRSRSAATHRSAGFPDLPTDRRGRRARLRRRHLERRDRARRPAAPDRRQAQRGDQPRRSSRPTFKARFAADRRRAGGRHAGGFRRGHRRDSAKWKDVVERSGAKIE